MKPNVWLSITKTDYLMASKREIWERPFIKFLNSNKLYTLPYSPRKWKDKGQLWERGQHFNKISSKCLLSIWIQYSFQMSIRKMFITLVKISHLTFKEGLNANLNVLIFRMQLFYRQVKIPNWENKAQCGNFIIIQI